MINFSLFNKKEIRRAIKQTVLAMPVEQRMSESAFVVERLLSILSARPSKVVALFSPLSDEVQIASLAERLQCRVVVPRVEDSASGEPNMEFFDYSANSLAEGAYGILEPQGDEPCAVEEIDVMIIPGVAFTRDGSRLGRGKGYYDRYLSQKGYRALRIGVCYGCQVVESLPIEPHDCRMDIVVAGE